MNGTLNGSTYVEKYDFNEPDIHERDYLLDDVFKDCRNRFFHTCSNEIVYLKLWFYFLPFV